MKKAHLTALSDFVLSPAYIEYAYVAGEILRLASEPF
ncbi:hypothetical protein BDW_03765 [Bdellovibrio bacteriovorus W]|nr:hypothetical protein BDW_03765 [Bdellovibrio bacteriovorus W]